MTLSFFARRTLCRGVGATALALAIGPVAAQQVLQIGRVEFPSPLSDIAEAVVKEAFKRCGLQAEFKRLPLSRSVAMANEGSIDGELMRISDAVKNFTDLVPVPTPVVMADVAIYSLDEKLVHLSRAEQRKRKVGLTRGTLMLLKHSQGMEVTDTQTIGTAFEMLANRRFDMIMMIFLDAEMEIARKGIQNIQRRPHYWASEPLYFYLNTKHAALVPKINAAMLAMQKEGLVKKIFRDKLVELDIAPLLPAD
jgi:polar amino acid transport system substrate-binding protein|nr:transporter substrate-binding domain-containing protein [uncultured Albidiferax sp.]